MPCVALVGSGVDHETAGVKKFLNRLLGMRIEMQNKIFTHFNAELEHQIKVMGRTSAAPPTSGHVPE